MMWRMILRDHTNKRDSVLSTAVVIWVLLIVGLGLWGCMSIEQMAPVVDKGMIEEGDQEGTLLSALQRGREVYLRRCSTCHVIEPIGRYTVLEWERILPPMNKDAKLDADEKADLCAYIFAAHRWLDRVPVSENNQ